MKVAIIDIGSNSMRLLLGLYQENHWINEPKRLWTTRLGKRLDDGALSPEAMAASYQAMAEMKEAINGFGAQKVYALATSAVREAPNGQVFLEALQAIQPMDSRILTGQEEAQYGFLGALGEVVKKGDYYGIIDVGGGSTELAVGDEEGILWSQSYQMGAVRFQTLSQEGPEAVKAVSQALWQDLPQDLCVDQWIGIGGTATTLGAMDLAMEIYDGSRLQGHKVSRESIQGMIDELRTKSPEERRAIPGLQAGRADIITAGAEIVAAAMDFYGVNSLSMSERDGMEGFEEGLCR